MTSDSEEYNVDVVEDVKTVSRLLNKFNFTCEADEVKELIEKIKEEIELEEFEQNLGTPPQKQKIEIGDFTQLNGYEFEEYLKNLFELLGYTAVQTPSSGDQGADLILSKDDEKIVVQAKKYDGKVSNKAVQEIAAAKNYYNTDRAMVVTNSSFTKSAIELAFSNDVELWDGRKLKNVIEDLEKGKR
ncbi:restriction endonuclease [Methanophagales archaeon]|nr:MAG: restriction endonuclease [Methanophagales archaeon]